LTRVAAELTGRCSDALGAVSDQLARRRRCRAVRWLGDRACASWTTRARARATARATHAEVAAVSCSTLTTREQRANIEWDRVALRRCRDAVIVRALVGTSDAHAISIAKLIIRSAERASRVGNAFLACEAFAC